jgi:hypothetical protein
MNLFAKLSIALVLFSMLTYASNAQTGSQESNSTAKVEHSARRSLNQRKFIKRRKRPGLPSTRQADSRATSVNANRSDGSTPVAVGQSNKPEGNRNVGLVSPATENKSESLKPVEGSNPNQARSDVEFGNVKFRNIPDRIVLVVIGLAVAFGLLMYFKRDKWEEALPVLGGAIVLLIAMVIFFVGGWVYQPSRESLDKIQQALSQIEDARIRQINNPNKDVPVVSRPAAPVASAASAFSDSQVNLRWIPSANNEDGFTVERKPSSSGEYVEIAKVGRHISNYADIGLAPDNTYFYRVRAYNSAGYSPYSEETKATTGTTSSASLANQAGSTDPLRLLWPQAIILVLSVVSLLFLVYWQFSRRFIAMQYDIDYLRSHLRKLEDR